MLPFDRDSPTAPIRHEYSRFSILRQDGREVTDAMAKIRLTA
jgi:hypothetical protein